jgi:hypothetical protein
MKNLLLILTFIFSFSLNAQYRNLNVNSLKFGCGNDLDLSYTGGLLVTAGVALYYVPKINYSNYYTYSPTQTQSFTPTQTQTIQNIGISLLITGGIILIEESIRHGIHKSRGRHKW